MDVVVVGGTQRRLAGVADRDHTALYSAGVVAEVAVGSAKVQRCVARPAPSGRRGAFKGLSASEEGWLVCADTELLHVVDGEVVETWTEPWFNDLHHAAVLGGVRHVVSTGTDGVVAGDRFVPLVERGLAPVGDVRGRDLRPHQVHPNHVFAVDGEVYVTCGRTGEVRSLVGSRRWRLADVVVHDGVVRDDGVWFTAVDGRLLRVDPGTGEVDRVIDLNALSPVPPPLGWCRGLAFVGTVAWVGMTRLRATRWRQHLAWLRGAWRGQHVATSLPTRLIGVDVAALRWVGTVPLEPEGLDAVFGVERVRS